MSIAIRRVWAATGAFWHVGRSSEGHAARPIADSWFDALAKLIPGEMIAAFMAVRQLSGLGDHRTANFAILIGFAMLLPIALRRSAQRAGIAAPRLQYVIRSVTFVLCGVGCDRELAPWLEAMSWLPCTGGYVIAVFAAFVLVPPGAADPPTE
jgi:hypothetical protein